MYNSWISITQYVMCISVLKGMCQSKKGTDIGTMCSYCLKVTAGLTHESILSDFLFLMLFVQAEGDLSLIIC